MSSIKFPAASSYSIRTLQDFGFRISFDVPEDCIAQIAMLAEARRQGIPMELEVRVQGMGEEPYKTAKNGSRQRRKRTLQEG